MLHRRLVCIFVVYCHFAQSAEESASRLPHHSKSGDQLSPEIAHAEKQKPSQKKQSQSSNIFEKQSYRNANDKKTKKKQLQASARSNGRKSRDFAKDVHDAVQRREHERAVRGVRKVQAARAAAAAAPSESSGKVSDAPSGQQLGTGRHHVSSRLMRSFPEARVPKEDTSSSLVETRFAVSEEEVEDDSSTFDCNALGKLEAQHSTMVDIDAANGCKSSDRYTFFHYGISNACIKPTEKLTGCHRYIFTEYNDECLFAKTHNFSGRYGSEYFDPRYGIYIPCWKQVIKTTVRSWNWDTGSAVRCLGVCPAVNWSTSLPQPPIGKSFATSALAPSPRVLLFLLLLFTRCNGF
eukprot:TRINITY_DN46030_c0_g1_i1.p1 TRINITY_DN46030_c0_g1~~TRINITY_DN46030_c0_g1_i1.p1  ORF type:complete len:351 (+),score=45.31 TRINITY_DN46030_c0_g1_i1:116-1168(+)